MGVRLLSEIDLCVKYVENLIMNDEVERALIVLDNVPAHWRDHPPVELKKLRSDILAAMTTAHAYMSSDLDSAVNKETAIDNLRFNLRGRLAEAEVRKYNELGHAPHIVDVGPGEYWIPIALKNLGLKFLYHDVGMDQRTKKSAHPLIVDHLAPWPNDSASRPRIFMALEIIEHLPEPRDLAVEAQRHCGGWPDRIHLSTPLYCYDPEPKDWRKPCGLPHLRAYTQLEFLDTAKKIFPGYVWQLYVSKIMSLRGLRQDVAESANVPLVEDGPK